MCPRRRGGSRSAGLTGIELSGRRLGAAHTPGDHRSGRAASVVTPPVHTSLSSSRSTTMHPDVLRALAQARHEDLLEHRRPRHAGATPHIHRHEQALAAPSRPPARGRALLIAAGARPSGQRSAEPPAAGSDPETAPTSGRRRNPRRTRRRAPAPVPGIAVGRHERVRHGGLPCERVLHPSGDAGNSLEPSRGPTPRVSSIEGIAGVHGVYTAGLTVSCKKFNSGLHSSLSAQFPSK